MDESKGYRPNRGARDANQELRERLFSERVHSVVEADIKGFFENVDHDWLERMLCQRVDDQAFIRLIRKWLKASVLEEAEQVIHPATGTPQGSIISPVLAKRLAKFGLSMAMEKSGILRFSRCDLNDLKGSPVR